MDPRNFIKPEIIEAYRATFMSEHGKRVLRDLERIVNRTSVNGYSPDPNAAIYKVAQQDLLKRIYNVLGRNPNDADEEQ